MLQRTPSLWNHTKKLFFKTHQVGKYGFFLEFYTFTEFTVLILLYGLNTNTLFVSETSAANYRLCTASCKLGGLVLWQMLQIGKGCGFESRPSNIYIFFLEDTEKCWVYGVLKCVGEAQYTLLFKCKKLSCEIFLEIIGPWCRGNDIPVSPDNKKIYHHNFLKKMHSLHISNFN